MGTKRDNGKIYSYSYLENKFQNYLYGDNYLDKIIIEYYLVLSFKKLFCILL